MICSPTAYVGCQVVPHVGPGPSVSHALAFTGVGHGLFGLAIVGVALVVGVPVVWWIDRQSDKHKPKF